MEKHQLLFESVFKEIPADKAGYLEKLTHDYPYFSIAQFYLLQSLSKESPEYKKQLKKTAVVFNNNYWLNFQLLESTRPVIAEEDNFIADNDHPLEETKEEQSPTLIQSAETSSSLATEQAVSTNTDTFQNGESHTIATELVTPVTSINDTAASADKNIPSNFEEDIDIKNVAGNNTIGEQIFTEKETSLKETEEIIVPENLGKITGNNHPYPDELSSPAESKEDITSEEQPADIKEDSTESQSSEPTAAAGIATATEMDIPSFKIPASVNTIVPDDAVLFEPLHTTDYFASVGIKLSEDTKPADKLGKQLKSFTEWLKTMKKIHAEQLIKASTAGEAEADNTESNILQLAEKSNVDDEVVTEAMAEVLVQQGRTKKAVEVLEKLSLLNPGKSAYFAAKIIQIKED